MWIKPLECAALGKRAGMGGKEFLFFSVGKILTALHGPRRPGRTALRYRATPRARKGVNSGRGGAGTHVHWTVARLRRPGLATEAHTSRSKGGMGGTAEATERIEGALLRRRRAAA